MLALPQYWLGQIEWDDPTLRKCFEDHVANYDFPAHYLRISCLFERPFWRDKLTGSYFMHDAFGGCCLYDESARYPQGSYGVLGWLVAGNHALALSNFNDQRLIELALASLPKSMSKHQKLFVEGKVHRWVGAVNAHPGGERLRDLRLRHSPDPVGNPYLFVVGDYLLDSTINGVVDSAEYASGALLSKIYREKHAGIQPVTTGQGQEKRKRFQEVLRRICRRTGICSILQGLFLRKVDMRPNRISLVEAPALQIARLWKCERADLEGFR